MRIARKLKAFHAMGLELMTPPDIVHRRLADSRALGQRAAAPLASAFGLGLQGCVDDGFDFLRAIGGFASSTSGNLPETLGPLLSKAGAPEPHGIAKLATALFLKALGQVVDSTVGDVVQLVRTLPCSWLESDTVTARLSLTLNIIICFQPDRTLGPTGSRREPHSTCPK